MSMSTTDSGVAHPWPHPADDASALSRLEKRLPTLLSVIAGMVDLVGFFTLGNIFTAHITGNLVVIAAVLVRGGRLNLAQALAIPVFILVVAAIWLLARASGRRGPGLARLLLLIQFLLLAGVLIFSVIRSEEHTSELQSPCNLVCRLLLEKKKKNYDVISPVDMKLVIV